MSEKAEEATAQQKARLAAAQLAEDFRECFGIGRSRSRGQKAVLDHLKKCAGGSGSAYRPDGSHDGISIVVAGIHRDGARSVLEVIDFQLERSLKTSTATTTKPQVRK